jgi:hypothetical protein
VLVVKVQATLASLLDEAETSSKKTMGTLPSAASADDFLTSQQVKRVKEGEWVNGVLGREGDF